MLFVNQDLLFKSENLNLADHLYEVLETYIEGTSETAIYPNIGELAGLEYVSLGFYGEMGEVCEVLKKRIRDANGDIGVIAFTSLKKELGDVSWYLARVTASLMDLSFKSNKATFEIRFDPEELQASNELQEVPDGVECASNVMYYSRAMLDNMTQSIAAQLAAFEYQGTYQFPSILSTIGTIQLSFTELMNQNPIFCTHPLAESMATVWTHYFILCLSLGMNPKEVLDLNYKKLISRKERGKIQGSGNDR